MRRISRSLRRTIPPALVVALAATAALAPLAAHAQAVPSDKAVIDYRQHVMGAIGANMGAIGDILKNKLDRPGAIAIHAQEMVLSAKLIAPAFQQKVVEGKTDAKPAIWSDAPKWEKAIGDYESAAKDLAAAAQGSDAAATGKAVKALGDACGGCHDKFRKPKEESYKNR